MYVGTQNFNLSKIWTKLWDLFIDLSDEEIDSADDYNSFISSFVSEQEWGIDVGVTNQEFEDITNSTVSLIQENENDITSSDNILDFAEVMFSMFEDVNVTPYISGNNSFLLNAIPFGDSLLIPLSLLGIYQGSSRFVHFITSLSDGCSVWKYNYTTDTWTELIGNYTGYADLPAGFGNHTNCAASKIVEFNDDLYVGTWRSPREGGCELWRYNGVSWTQVVGKNAQYTDSGFGDSNNSGVWSMKVFNGSLYIGTLNANFTTNGFCQIWRSQDGENWSRVVNRGFRDDGAGEHIWNVYSWKMEEFQGELYAGTFNAQIVRPNYMGCQLWKSPSGDSGTWTKVGLPDGNTSGFKDGFGESENWGIRELRVLNNKLYVGTAVLAAQDEEGLEIWRYNGTNWTCIIGDNSGYYDYRDDGFGDTLNKYAWSMNVSSDNKLWVGTLNGHPWGPPRSNGCEVWCYNGSSWTGIVNTTYGEIPNGFGDIVNVGSRSMIEYPEGSGNIVVGTFRASTKEMKNNRRLFNLGILLLLTIFGFGGCEIWIRYT
jgi:hypothetical protein